MESSLICLGEIVAPQGIKGELRIKTFTENPSDLVSYGLLRTVEGAVLTLKITQIKTPHLLLATIAGCHDRDAAASFVGTKLYIDRSQLPPAEEDAFYYHELIGMDVVDENSVVIGIVENVGDCGAGNFLEISGCSVSGEPLLFTLPFNKEAVPEVDKNARRIHILAHYLLS